jgi:hypothetical protein
MKPYLLLFFGILTNVGFSQNFREKDLKTEIREVTVFLNSAQIFETGSVSLSPGKAILRIKDLSPFLDDKSIQVKGDGDFTILSVNHKLNYLEALTRDQKTDSLHRIGKSIDDSMTRDNARLAVLNEKFSVLNANKSLGGTSAGVSITQLKQAIELFETEIVKIKDEEIRIRSVMEERKKSREKIDKQLKELNDRAIQPTAEIEIRVSAESSVTAKFRVTYLVGNAGWFPKYDIRVDNIKKPLQITYKAEVHQNTGVDWKNVKLRFSNGNPSQSGTVPDLNQWNLSFARLTSWNQSALYGSRAAANPDIRFVRGRVVDSNGEPIPGANVIVKGTTIGTATDASGNYYLSLPNGPSTLVFSFVGYQSQEIPVTQSETNLSLQEDVMQLSEVVVAGYASGVRIRGASSLRQKAIKPASNPLVTTTIENQTTVEIEVAEPYSIKSNGEKMLVDLKVIEANALYEYYAVPKLDKDAFLMARIVNWDQYNLLEGEANLYFEEAYVGRSILNAKSLEDTLNISLGRDKNIVVGREKNEEFCKRKTLGSNVSESRGFKIMVRNKKSQPINITIFDQIPVSIVSDISVTPEELSKAKFDERSGKVTWQLKIDPQQQKDLKLHYEVRYPKKERVFLE